MERYWEKNEMNLFNTKPKIRKLEGHLKNCLLKLVSWKLIKYQSIWQMPIRKHLKEQIALRTHPFRATSKKKKKKVSQLCQNQRFTATKWTLQDEKRQLKNNSTTLRNFPLTLSTFAWVQQWLSLSIRKIRPNCELPTEDQLKI